jgi:lysophospholipase L1-like esterase
MRVFAGGLLAALLVCIITTDGATAQTPTYDWLSDGAPSLVKTTLKHGFLPHRQPTCNVQQVKVKTYDGLGYKYTDGCVVQGESIRMAYSIEDSIGSTTSRHISVGADQMFYEIYTEYIDIYLVPNSNKVIVIDRNGRGNLRIYNDFSKTLKRELFHWTGYTWAYQINITEPSYPEVSNATRVEGMGLSSNGKYLVYAIPRNAQGSVEVRRLNLHNGTTKYVTHHAQNYGYSPSPMYSITDDGGTVVSPRYDKVTWWRVDGSCDDSTDNCGQKSILLSGTYGLALKEHWGDWALRGASMPRFNESGSELTFGVILESDNDRWPGTYHELTLRSNEAVPSDGSETVPPEDETEPEKQLEYLALGDSFSSGEGDVGTRPNGSSYYTPVTDFDGGCHLSTRSYPFLLRDKWGISSDKMESVACSGAEVLPDYIGSLYSYKGQTEAAKSVPDSERGPRQERALDVFIPGYVPQIEFVKKYQPKTVTLTAGGNDVGFADILRYCAEPTWQGLLLFADDTCGYAYSGSTLHKLLYSSIDSQYSYTKLLIDKIQAVSPETEIILFGYPSFISPGSGCSTNSAAIDFEERQMMQEAISYMNQSLRKAASEKSAIFIDLESALHGGRLCEGSKYVNGIYSSSDTSEMFHPNAAGHEKMAESIFAQHTSPSAARLVRVLSEYVPPSDFTPTFRKEMVPSGTMLIGSSNSVTLESYTLRPGSQATLTGYSEETHLGTFQASTDGSLSVIIPAGILPIGKHVLILAGETYSGEPIQYTQFVDVYASETDADGDGIPNSEDRCNFITTWVDEKTGKDVCLQPKTQNKARSEEINTSTSPGGSQYGDGPKITNNDDRYGTDGQKEQELAVETRSSSGDGEFNTSANTHVSEPNSVKVGSRSTISLMWYTLGGVAILLIIVGGMYGLYKRMGR